MPTPITDPLFGNLYLPAEFVSAETADAALAALQGGPIELQNVVDALLLTEEDPEVGEVVSALKTRGTADTVVRVLKHGAVQGHWNVVAQRLRTVPEGITVFDSVDAAASKAVRILLTEDEKLRRAARMGEKYFGHIRLALARPETVRRLLQAHPDLFMGAQLNPKLSWMDLSSVNLAGAKLYGADLTGTRLANTNLKEAQLVFAKLEGSYLALADLSEVNANGSDFTRADLSRARLVRANLLLARLIQANLTDAILADANLRNANLEGATVTGAHFERANFEGADLRQTGITRELLDRIGATYSDKTQFDV